MSETPIPKSGDVIKAAIVAAGGHDKVAERFGLSLPSIYAWVTRGAMPGHYVRQLSAMGGNVVAVDQLLAAIERTAQERAAA